MLTKITPFATGNFCLLAVVISTQIGIRNKLIQVGNLCIDIISVPCLNWVNIFNFCYFIFEYVTYKNVLPIIIKVVDPDEWCPTYAYVCTHHHGHTFICAIANTQTCANDWQTLYKYTCVSKLQRIFISSEQQHPFKLFPSEGVAVDSLLSRGDGKKLKLYFDAKRNLATAHIVWQISKRLSLLSKKLW